MAEAGKEEKKVRTAAKFRCMYCNAITQKVCKNCEITFYCSVEHERMDWELHKLECLDIVRRAVKQQRERVERHGLKELTNLREQLRKLVFQNYGEGNLELAVIYSKKLVHIARLIYEQSDIEYEYSEVCADILLGMRVLLKNQDLRGVQLGLDEFMAQYGSMLVDMSNLPAGTGEFSSEQLEHFKRKCAIIAAVHNLYYAVGNLRKCEEVFIKYCHMFEQAFGARSLEFSNCLFLLGVFYYEHSYYPRSIACFRNCLEIRLDAFKNTEESICIVDCYYNLGILEKVNGNAIKAIEHMKKVIALRQNIFLSLSVQVADAQETYGNILIEEGDFESGLVALLECYATRKKMLGKDEHPDVQRVEGQIVEVYKSLSLQIEKNKDKKVQQEWLKKVKSSLEDNLLISNKIKSNIREKGSEKTFTREVEDQKEEVREVMDKELKSHQDYILRINEVVERLSPFQLKLLSELEVVNAEKISHFERIKNISESKFMATLSDEVLEELKLRNESIFAEIAAQNMRGEGDLDA